MNYIEFTVLKAFTSEFKLRPYQSLQWNVCAAHVNNFSSNLVERVDFSDSRVVYKFFLINNIELKCSFVRCRKYHKSWSNGAAELHNSVNKRVRSSSGQSQNCVWLGTNRDKNDSLIIGNCKQVWRSGIDHFLSCVLFSRCLSSSERTLDDFRRWKVPELKEFLRIHGLKTTGTKDELTALAFGAEQLSVPVKLTAEEEIIQKKKQYQSLLNVNGEQLPDPFTELKDNWISEETGVEKWPPILQMQIAEFILTAEQGSDLGKRRRSDYKEGKAFSYLDSQWLKEVFYHPISDTHELCLLKSQSTPSQRIGNVPHKIWVCVKKINGTVEAAYCTCFAG